MDVTRSLDTLPLAADPSPAGSYAAHYRTVAPHYRTATPLYIGDTRASRIARKAI